MGKTKKGITIDFLGLSSAEVTGSMYLIKFKEYQILMECGMYQGCANNIIKNYRTNHDMLKQINPKTITHVICSHSNIDHCGNIPYLYANGCTAPLIVPKGNKELFKIMFQDSSKIMASDCLKLITKYNMKSHPLYTVEDIDTCLEYLQEYNFNEEVILNDFIKLKLISAGHIVGSCQMFLEFKDGNLNKKIAFSGDIGSSIPAYYIQPKEKLPFADVLIGESTYAGNNREHSIQDRLKDMEKIKTIIDTVCVENHKRVLIPVFSLSRLQTMLTSLYELYGENENFTERIIVDTPMGIKICNCYSKIITKDKELWDKVFNWKNIIWCDGYKESKIMQSDLKSGIILSSSGMMHSGRVINWLKQLLPDEGNHCIFCGYSAEGSLATVIKEGKKNKYITVEKENIPNKMQVTTLFSFSSHACHNELLNYYTTVEYNKLYLVHGNMADKILFAQELQNELSKVNRTSKVICTNIDTVCNL